MFKCGIAILWMAAFVDILHISWLSVGITDKEPAVCKPMFETGTWLACSTAPMPACPPGSGINLITPETDFSPFCSVYTQQTHSSRVLRGRCGAAWQKIDCTARLMDTFSICNVIFHANILPAKHWTGQQHSSAQKDKLFRFSSRPFSPFNCCLSVVL